MPLGLAAEKYSVIGGIQWSFNLSINKHLDDGKWWLSIGHNRTPIGYWPKEIFTYLGEVANRVEWGGEINNPEALIPSPEMGNGYQASYNIEYSASIYQATVVYENRQSVDPGRDTHKVWNCEDLYTVKDGGYRGGVFGRIMYYGGIKPPY
ncbi:N-acetyldiaminopimelate deacetylase [Bienertia sinuspersici]